MERLLPMVVHRIERAFDFFDKQLLLLEKQQRWSILRQSAWLMLGIGEKHKKFDGQVESCAQV
jgi:hypothetical protein